MSVCQKFQTYSIDKGSLSVASAVHLDHIYSCTSPDEVLGNLLLEDSSKCLAPFLLAIFPLLFFSRWWPHKARWKMSSSGVREAIWGLIDGSRRTTAAMFSDLLSARRET